MRKAAGLLVLLLVAGCTSDSGESSAGLSSTTIETVPADLTGMLVDVVAGVRSESGVVLRGHIEAADQAGIEFRVHDVVADWSGGEAPEVDEVVEIPLAPGMERSRLAAALSDLEIDEPLPALVMTVDGYLDLATVLDPNLMRFERDRHRPGLRFGVFVTAAIDSRVLRAEAPERSLRPECEGYESGEYVYRMTGGDEVASAIRFAEVLLVCSPQYVGRFGTAVSTTTVPSGGKRVIDLVGRVTGARFGDGYTISPAWVETTDGGGGGGATLGPLTLVMADDTRYAVPGGTWVDSRPICNELMRDEDVVGWSGDPEYMVDLEAVRLELEPCVVAAELDDAGRVVWFDVLPYLNDEQVEIPRKVIEVRDDGTVITSKRWILRVADDVVVSCSDSAFAGQGLEVLERFVDQWQGGQSPMVSLYSGDLVEVICIPRA